jgi:hypothetical protein
VVVTCCSTSDPALLKNRIEKHSYIPVKMGGGRSMRSELLVAHEELGQWPLLTVYVVPV